MINVAVMGYGTVGSGVVEVLESNRASISKRLGKEISIKYVLDLRDFPENPIQAKIVHDFKTILEDDEVQIVVETMGGLKPSYEFVKQSLLSGKHVATSNKALVAAHGTELLAIAREKHINFMFEASVGGGIPIIRPLHKSLTGDVIEQITGILNGTTNYILTKMDKEGASFEDALREAQELGYAERNPQADVDGHDTCRKLAILTALATGREVDYEDIYTEGITKITDMDFKYADKLKAGIKLFGTSKLVQGVVAAWVAPVMIGSSHSLFAVSGVYNGIILKGNMVGETMFYGSGAGRLPTASAVVSDIVEEAMHLTVTVLNGWSDQRLPIADQNTAEFRFFVRLEGTLKERLSEVETLFGTVETIFLEGMDEFAFITNMMSEGDYHKLSEQLGGVRQMIRTEL